MSALLKRLQRLEQEQRRPGSCLVCELARMGGEVVECDRLSCRIGLADLLMGMRDGKPIAAA